MLGSSITADSIALVLEQFLAQSPHATVIENGEVLFEFPTARYSVSGEGKCVLHLWSEERNAVRRVIDIESRGSMLRLQVLRFGQSKATVLEICADREHRKAAALRATRAQYQRLLERVLLRESPSSRLEAVSSRPDLEHSFSPVYTRALVRTGQSAFVVLGVNAGEPQASVDGALTFGVLWMDYQRGRLAGRAHVEGLKLFVPPGRSDLVRQRMANLDKSIAKWHLYALDEHSETCERIDLEDCGNIETRLVRAVNREAALERFAVSIERIQALAPDAEITVDSNSQITFRLRGLEFARARLNTSVASLHKAEEITFGFARAEHVLDDTNNNMFRDLVQRLAERRSAAGAKEDVLYRLCPERWLESLITCNIRTLDERFEPRFVYSQVPAFSAADRAMLDLLTCTVDGHLAILELKADEDIHLPLQGLDYWARVRWQQQRDGFRRYGYFPGCELSDSPPLLYFVTPALRTHPATDILLRYFSPQIPWRLVQIDERWREGVRVVNRKRAPTKFIAG